VAISFVEDFNARPASLAMASAFSARMRGVSLLEGSLTRSRQSLRVSDDAAFCETFGPRSALPAEKPATKTDSISYLLLIGLVFVGFEIGGECAFGESLGVFFGAWPSRTRRVKFLTSEPSESEELRQRSYEVSQN